MIKHVQDLSGYSAPEGQAAPLSAMFVEYSTQHEGLNYGKYQSYRYSAESLRDTLSGMLQSAVKEKTFSYNVNEIGAVVYSFDVVDPAEYLSSFVLPMNGIVVQKTD